MTAAPEHSTSPGLAAPCRDDAATRGDAEGQRPEGRRPAASPSTPIFPTDVSPLAPDPARASGALAAMRAQFIADFAGGTMGDRHNTYEHRSRILRQLAGKLSPSPAPQASTGSTDLVACRPSPSDSKGRP